MWTNPENCLAEEENTSQRLEHKLVGWVGDFASSIFWIIKTGWMCPWYGVHSDPGTAEMFVEENAISYFLENTFILTEITNAQ